MNFDTFGFLVWLIRRFKSSGKGRVPGLFVFRRVDLVFQTVQRRGPEEVADLDPVVNAVVRNLPVLLRRELHRGPFDFAELIFLVRHILPLPPLAGRVNKKTFKRKNYY